MAGEPLAARLWVGDDIVNAANPESFAAQVLHQRCSGGNRGGACLVVEGVVDDALALREDSGGFVSIVDGRGRGKGIVGQPMESPC